MSRSSLLHLVEGLARGRREPHTTPLTSLPKSPSNRPIVMVVLSDRLRACRKGLARAAGRAASFLPLRAAQLLKAMAADIGEYD